MDDKINRGFSIVFMVVVLLSILAIVAAPVMAKNCDMSMGVQCTEEYYTADETFVNWGSFYNSEPGTINYRMTLTVYNPSGGVVDREEFSDEGYISSARHCLRTSPPRGGWEPGIYRFRNSVFAYNSYGCTYSGSGECTFTVLPDKSDLVITDVWSDNGTIYYKIKNTGYEKVGASNTSLAIDGIFITSHYVGPLEPKEGRTESFDYTWTCTGGSDILEVCADYMDAVEEGNEKNNCRTKTWICKDFVITDIWTDNGTIYYKITNRGDEKVGASNTSLTIDGIFITSHYVGPLEPKEGRTESFDYTWTCTGGSDILEVCADCMDAVEEGNEENNCRHVKRICPLDISVSPTSFDLRLPPDVVTKYTLAIRNIGGGKLEFNIMDVEKKVASARASSLDTTFNNVIGPSDVTSCEHETTFGNTEDSSNRSIVIDDEYTTKSQKSSLIHFESIGAENINEEDIYYKLDTLLEENNQTSDEHNQTLKETIIDKAEPIWVIQGQNTTTIDVGTPILLYANDTTGNTCVSEPRKVIANDKMAAPQDTAPPPCITNLSHISGQTWINWTWVNPDDEDFEDVMVDINEIWQADTSDSYYNATGLVPNASYEIDIRTVGKDGNMNETVVNDTALTLTLAFSVSIISPPDGQVFKVFKQNEMIDVHCSVSGGAPPYAFNWSSSIDGFISDEESLSKPLSAGVHVISLSATDSTGLDKTASANISVVMGKEEKKIRGVATTIIVPDSYPTIQQAVDNATDGDTILVRSGAYHENIRIDKDLTVEGEDMEATIIDGRGSGDCVRVSSADVVISGFTIKNAGNYGIYAYSSDFNINNATITDCGKDAIYFSAGKSLTLRDSVLENCGGGLAYNNYYKAYYATGNAAIERNIIRNNTGNGLYIHLDGKGREAVINDNIITNNTGYGIKCDYYSNYIDSITMRNNTVRNCVYDGVFIEGAIDVDITDLIIENPGNNGLCASCTRNMTIKSPFSIKNVSGYGIYAYGPNFTLDNATITDCGKDAIYFSAGKSLTLRDSVLENCGGGLAYNNYYKAYYATGNAAIERNIIRNNTGNGLYIHLDGKGREAVINDNIITNNTGYGIKCDYYSNYIDSITMRNNTVRNCVYDGVFIEGAIDVDITDLIIENPGNNGLCASCTRNMTIKNSTVKNSEDDGIYLRGAFTPVLANNTITGSSGYGIYLYISSSTKNLGKLRNNILTKNKYGFSITGTSIESYYHDIDTSNTINGKPIYYLVGEENKILDGIPMGYLGLISCENIEAKNLELANSGQGILMVNTSDSEIYFNNFINNADNVCSYKSINIWNSTEKITYTYKEKTHINYMGNYWDDCTSVDADDDGIWDHPCPVDSDYDYYPLVGYVSDLADLADWLSVSPRMDTVDPGNQTDITVTLNTTGLDFGEYHTNITITSNDPDEQTIVIPVRLTVTSSQKGDLNHDGKLTPADAAIALQIAATGAQNPAADVSGDGCVTSLDALMILQAAAGNIEL